MGMLRSALDEVRSADLRHLSDAEIESDLTELERAAGIIEAERARRVAEVERRGSFSADGHLSITSWVESRFQTGWSEAARQVRVARALEEMPVTREALVEGEVSRHAVRELVAAREASPQEFARVEETLVDAARTLPVRELRRAMAHWKELVDAEAAEREDRERFERRGLHCSATFEGMVRVDGLLDPECGQTVITALRAVTDASARAGDPADSRSPAQRRADALGEVCREWLDRSDRGSVGGERPHLTVTVDYEALRGQASHGGGRGELDDAVSVGAEAVRRLACDASIARVVTRGRSEVLDVGRRTPVVPAAIRRAVAVRDRHCRFPGCDRPRSWCDAHHVVHWADGGATGLPNLVLLCRRHHRAVHEGFGLRMVEGRPVFSRPDGSVLEERAPP